MQFKAKICKFGRDRFGRDRWAIAIPKSIAFQVPSLLGKELIITIEPEQPQ